MNSTPRRFNPRRQGGHGIAAGSSRRHEVRAITARFVGDATQTAFTVNGAKPTPAAAILGAGATLRMGARLKASLGYDAEIRSNAKSHTIQATVRVVW